MNTATFLQYLEFEKRYSAHTLTAYRNDLRQFEAYLTALNLGWGQVTPREIRGWLAQLLSQGCQPRTLRRKLSALQALYRFAQRRGDIEHNPAAKMRSPKIGKRLPATVEAADMDRLFAQLPPAGSDDFATSRDRLILELLYGAGLRRSELIQLTDADVGQGKLRIVGKGDKTRLIPCGAAINHALDHYLQVRSLAFPNYTGGSLLLTDRGQPLYPKWVYLKVRQHLGAVTTQEKRSPHVLRHAFATHLLENGADLNAVKELLGHTSLASTQVYTHYAVDQLKKVYQQAHPKAKLTDEPTR